MSTFILPITIYCRFLEPLSLMGAIAAPYSDLISNSGKV
jgi:hypothetical protein